MIKVTAGNNVTRKSHIIEETTVIREFLEDEGFEIGAGAWQLDGATLGPGDINKTFAEMRVTEKCFLLNVVKTDNA